MNQKPEIHTMVCLSTAHLTQFARAYIEDACDPMECTHFDIIAYRKHTFGYFVALIDDTVDESGIPESILDCMRYAESKGADWIMFDIDGPIMAELPNRIGE